MIKQTKAEVDACKRCLLQKAPQEKAKLCPIAATSPLDLIHVDYTTIEVDMENSKCSGHNRPYDTFY